MRRFRGANGSCCCRRIGTDSSMFWTGRPANFSSGKPFVRKLTWASGIGRDGRPQELEGAKPTPTGTKTCPAVRGATNWYSTAYNPSTRLFYVMAVEDCNHLPAVRDAADMCRCAIRPTRRRSICGRSISRPAESPGRFRKSGAPEVELLGRAFDGGRAWCFTVRPAAASRR